MIFAKMYIEIFTFVFHLIGKKFIILNQKIGHFQNETFLMIYFHYLMVCRNEYKFDHRLDHYFEEYQEEF